MNRLHIFTIVLDGMPFLPAQFAAYNRLPDFVDWRWVVCEGAAMNLHCTKWCQPQEPRLSNDGTTQFLNEIKGHPRVTVHQRPMWFGKVEMVNTALREFTKPGVVLEADADELWQPEVLADLVSYFRNLPHVGQARFFCRYFVGPNIVITSQHSYGNRPTEWARCWRWTDKLKALSHEPPIMDGLSRGECVPRETTLAEGFRFDHYAYAFEKTVAAKEKFYGYRDAVAHWRKLQANRTWPVPELRAFLPWVDPGVTADRLWTPPST